jgi:predicted transposase YbfD/YdcC
MECNTGAPQPGAALPATEFIFSLSSLYSYLAQLTDRRKRRGIRYPLATILVVLILAKLCGQDKAYGIADWAQQRRTFLVEALRLKRGRLPHHTTYRRILETSLDGDEFERTLSEFVRQLPQAGQSVVIAIDGKTLRGTITLEDPFGVHLLVAYLPGEGLVLMQMVVEKDKENEIVVAPKLLNCLDLRNKVVVGDAMHTQRAVSLQIVEAGGDYVWVVKDNQPTTRQALEQLFAPPKPIPGWGCPPTDFRTAQTVNKSHGRLEERSLTVSSLLNDYLDWPGLGQVFKLERHFTTLATGAVHSEIQYGLTSLTAAEASPERLLEIVRSEWGVENGLHYRRDVTFHEDQTRMTHPVMGRAMASINNLVIGLLNRQGFDNHAHARRLFEADPAKALALILGL